MKKLALVGSLFSLLILVSPVSAHEFHGYLCTQDCSGHEAGYEWADRHDITDPDDCGGNSQSFIEGCRAYAEEHEDEQTEDCDEDDSDDCGE